MQKRILIGVILLVFAVASSGTLRADAILTLTPSTLNTSVGGTVDFTGSLTNTGAGDLYLNGDAVLFQYSGLTVDDSPFFADSPLFLSPDASYLGPFFDVTVNATTPSGSYDGTYTIQGGTDANAFDDVATEDFMVDVDSPVPEPWSLFLLASGLVAFTISHRRRSRILCLFEVILAVGGTRPKIWTMRQRTRSKRSV
jgi:hypothetical protein